MRTRSCPREVFGWGHAAAVQPDRAARASASSSRRFADARRRGGLLDSSLATGGLALQPCPRARYSAPATDAIIGLALQCGMRRTEIHRLEEMWMHYDNVGVVIVWEHAGPWDASRREVPYPVRVRSAVWRWLEFRALGLPDRTMTRLGWKPVVVRNDLTTTLAGSVQPPTADLRSCRSGPTGRCGTHAPLGGSTRDSRSKTVDSFSDSVPSRRHCPTRGLREERSLVGWSALRSGSRRRSPRRPVCTLSSTVQDLVRRR